jgi:hypothetical protein
MHARRPDVLKACHWTSSTFMAVGSNEVPTWLLQALRIGPQARSPAHQGLEEREILSSEVGQQDAASGSVAHKRTPRRCIRRLGGRGTQIPSSIWQHLAAVLCELADSAHAVSKRVCSPSAVHMYVIFVHYFCWSMSSAARRDSSSLCLLRRLYRSCIDISELFFCHNVLQYETEDFLEGGPSSICPSPAQEESRCPNQETPTPMLVVSVLVVMPPVLKGVLSSCCHPKMIC